VAYLLSGSYPVDGSTLAAVVEAHRLGVRRLLRDVRADVPETFARIVERAIASEPHERFASAGALEAELSAFLGEVRAHADVARTTAAVPSIQLNGTDARRTSG